MKRQGHIYSQIYCIENLILADQKARKGKRWQYGVKVFDRDREANILRLHNMLKNRTYRTSAYTTFKVYEPKERIVSRLPYFPDRIAQHAAMNILEKKFTDTFTADTYSCIKGKGILGAANAVKKALRDILGTQYCLKMDIKKFYPNIDHAILKQLLRRKFKDAELLGFLDEIIDSTEGIPIGNYTSQYFANFYLSYFDHWLKEKKGVKYYFRYADDMVIFASNKEELHQLLAEIRSYLGTKLKLTVKDNYQIFPVKARGVDFTGYVFRHKYTRLRKSIKQQFARKRKIRTSIVAYYGWAKHCNSKHLLKKLIHENIQGPWNKAA